MLFLNITFYTKSKNIHLHKHNKIINVDAMQIPLLKFYQFLYLSMEKIFAPGKNSVLHYK